MSFLLFALLISSCVYVSVRVLSQNNNVHRRQRRERKKKFKLKQFIFQVECKCRTFDLSFFLSSFPASAFHIDDIVDNDVVNQVWQCWFKGMKKRMIQTVKKAHTWKTPYSILTIKVCTRCDMFNLSSVSKIMRQLHTVPHTEPAAFSLVRSCCLIYCSSRLTHRNGGDLDDIIQLGQLWQPVTWLNR